MARREAIQRDVSGHGMLVDLEEIGPLVRPVEHHEVRPDELRLGHDLDAQPQHRPAVDGVGVRVAHLEGRDAGADAVQTLLVARLVQLTELLEGLGVRSGRGIGGGSDGEGVGDLDFEEVLEGLHCKYYVVSDLASLERDLLWDGGGSLPRSSAFSMSSSSLSSFASRLSVVNAMVDVDVSRLSLRPYGHHGRDRGLLLVPGVAGRSS